MNRLLIAASLVVAAGVAQLSLAQDLTLGSKAPKLEVKKFIKGEPVKGFEKGKLYVVEFWATWCGPCRATIPHLTKLQKQYKKEVTFIGVAILEEDQDEVDKFVKEMGDDMDYRVAIDLVPDDADGDEGAMVKNWMEPSEQQGIPAAFIVNGDGLVAWIGHPGQIDDPLEKIVSGKWDIAAEAKKIQEQAAERKKLTAVFEKLRKLFGDFEESGESKELLKALDSAAKELPDRATQFQMIKFQVLSSPKGNVDQALELGGELLELDGVGDNPDALNNIAWMLVAPEREKKADAKLLKFALKVATKADNLKKNQDPSIADTLAKAYFDNGMLEKAVETQERVIELLPGTELENDMGVKKRLRQYKKALESAKSEGDAKK
jgi:thiol-disulfide isomerase/thioredoxin